MISTTTQTEVLADAGLVSASFWRIEILASCVGRLMGRGLGGLRAGKYSCAGDVICEEFVADFGPIVKVVRLLILPEEGHFVHQNAAPRIS